MTVNTDWTGQDCLTSSTLRTHTTSTTSSTAVCHEKWFCQPNLTGRWQYYSEREVKENLESFLDRNAAIVAWLHWLDLPQLLTMYRAEHFLSITTAQPTTYIQYYSNQKCLLETKVNIDKAPTLS